VRSCSHCSPFHNTTGVRRYNQGASREHIYTSDDNHHGRTNHFRIYRNGRIASAQVDRNFDGKIDEWETFDSEGRPEHLELDENFDA
jgi:hypothetical protein